MAAHLVLYDGIPDFDNANSFRRHQHRKRQLDEFLIFIDGFEGAAHVVGDIGGSALLDPVRQSHDAQF